MSHESRLVGVGDDRFKKGKKSRVWCQEVVQRSSGPLQPLPTYPTPPAPLIWLGSLALFIHFTFSGLQSCCIGGKLRSRTGCVWRLRFVIWKNSYILYSETASLCNFVTRSYFCQIITNQLSRHWLLICTIKNLIIQQRFSKAFRQFLNCSVYISCFSKHLYGFQVAIQQANEVLQ